MTTSLPTTSSNEIFPGATVPAAGSAALAEGLTAPTAGSAVLPADFGALLGGDASTASSIATPLPPASPPATAPVANALEAKPVVRPTATPATITATPMSRAASLPTDARGLALESAHGVVAAVPAEAANEVARPVDVVKADSVVPDRATLEAIVALLTPVVVAFDPPPVAGAPMAAGEQPSNAQVPALAVTEQNGGNDGSAPWPAAPRATITLTLPGQPPVPLDETLAAASLADDPGRNIPAQAQAAVMPTVPPASTPRRESRAILGPGAGSGEGDFSTARAGESRATPVVTAMASVELKDGAVVALARPGEFRMASGDADVVRRFAAPHAPASAMAENSAALPRAGIGAAPENERRFGKNFLSSDGQQFTTAPSEAGIGVAEMTPTMLLTPHDPMTAVPATVPALVSTMAAAPQAAGAPGAEPMPQLVAASVARRAVETVTNVVEAQAISKLQPVPSVQLKFKIGHEDLAVRVALRDGVVHTEFRTDSPELRAALQQEWKAVAAQPESAMRYLEPVVSAASSSQGGTNSFAQQQQQQSPGQSAAQQQQQQQQHSQSRAAAEFFGSVSRSTPFQPREGGAASTIAAAVLPTSVHLSAVA